MNDPKGEGTFIEHVACPHCGSSDAYAIYSDGQGHCFSCNKTDKEAILGDMVIKGSAVKEPKADSGLITEGKFRDFNNRGISKTTCKKFKYFVSKFHTTNPKYMHLNGQDCHVATYYSDKNEPVAQKLRFKNKEFLWRGDAKQVLLFGSHLWGKGKRIVITEGEIDTLSIAEAQNCQWPVVSLPNGASGARKDLAKCVEYLDQFEEIILCFDTDEPGLKAAQSCAEMLGPKRAKIVHLPVKDANEMLKQERIEELLKCLWNAKPYKPDGIIYGSDLWEDIEKDEAIIPSISYPWKGLDKITNGMRKGELVTWTSGTGMGKSTIVRELAYHLGNTNEQNVGMIFLEEPNKRTVYGLMGIEAGAPLHLSREGYSKDQLREIFNKTLGTGRYYLINHFGSTDLDTLKSRIRYLHEGCECDWIILDHLSIVVSGQSGGDERRNIDNIMTEVKSLAIEINVGIHLVSHLKRTDGRTHEEGGVISLSDLRGSQSIAQLSDIVIGLERNQQGEYPNITTVRMLKNRFVGLTGITGYLSYISETGRVSEMKRSEVEALEGFSDINKKTKRKPSTFNDGDYNF